ncbi:hypothetical protein ACQUQU_17435 [Thalassolituus sp. LLYu03]|uniref:hypothetical protein n=1 Tax=Thalassolituus sp. LLYu03 TaxID=3421656 RepID=UPI003D2A9ECA
MNWDLGKLPSILSQNCRHLTQTHYNSVTRKGRCALPEYVFVKFGEPEHMERFVRDGEMYMNSFNFFRVAEGDENRHDKHEGVDQVHQALSGVLKMKDPDSGEYREVATITKATIWETPAAIDVMNMFCMYGVETSASEKTSLVNLDARVYGGFGGSMVIIKDPDKFIELVKKSAESRGLHVKFGKVRYVDFSTYHGKAGPFVKSDAFSYQNELRFVAYGGEPSVPLKLMLGNLSDITVTLPSSQAASLSFELGSGS